MFKVIKTVLKRKYNTQVFVVGNTIDTRDFAEVFTLIKELDKIPAA